MLYKPPLIRRKDEIVARLTTGARATARLWYTCCNCGYNGSAAAWKVGWTIRQVCPKCQTKVASFSDIQPEHHQRTLYATCLDCHKIHKSTPKTWDPKKTCEKCGGKVRFVRPQVKGNWEALGFRRYSDYLKSDLWCRIRTRVLERDKRRCRLCGCKASQAHHLSYHIDVLVGDNLKPLMTMCRQCHKEIEFGEDGTKRLLHEANHEIKCRLAEKKAQKRINKRRKRVARRRRPNVRERVA